jgi:hypothetical protein
MPGLEPLSDGVKIFFTGRPWILQAAEILPVPGQIESMIKCLNIKKDLINNGTCPEAEEQSR